MINPEEYEEIDENIRDVIVSTVNNAPFSKLVGLQKEVIKKNYARMRLPYKPALNQPAGLVHGGAIATLIDTAVVGAILSGSEVPPKKLVTIDMHIHYLDAAKEEDLIAHAAVRRRGRKIVYLEVEVQGSDSGKAIAHGELAYMIG